MHVLVPCEMLAHLKRQRNEELKKYTKTKYQNVSQQGETKKWLGKLISSASILNHDDYADSK